MKLDHGVIGNGRLLALVSPTASVDWLCMPRFDSPSVFARLLDENKGGSFDISLAGEKSASNQAYLRNTNVLRTELSNDSGSIEVIDFAPRLPKSWDVELPISMVRVVRPLRGAPRVRVDFDPRLDYARTQTELVPTTHGVEVTGGETTLQLETNAPIDYVLTKRDFVLSDPIFFALTYGKDATHSTLSQVLQDLNLTVEGWRAWSQTCALPLFMPHHVLRSALCLKLHAYEDTGAIIAATTTSVPEAMGTQRSWDYRFCWLRDAAFVVEALRRLSQLREGERFMSFLRDVAEAGPLQPLYGIDGRRDLPEVSLPNLAGFNGNGHVRIGNAAAHQMQNDLMGELVLCLDSILSDPRIVPSAETPYFPLVQRLVEEAIRSAPLPDTSIWEFRTVMRNYTFSRAMCWAAIERGAAIARRFGETALADRWRAIAKSEQAIILSRGFNQAKGFFTQEIDGEHADASLLLLPAIGIIDAKDPRFLKTLDAYAKILAPDGLMKRYVHDDDFGEPTNSFTICSFWWAEALALAGQLDEAVALFERVCKFANPVGLFSEDIDPKTGELLGNFPQAYTHVGLIHSAVTIGELLAARDGKVRSWT